MKTKYIILSILLSICTTPTLAQQRLVILHTNDTHSRVEPLPKTNMKHPGMGGMINRMAIIDSIRAVEDNVLLIDAGDFVQGTPYFNMFGGRVETSAMNIMKYDVGTIGNHEFDNGLDSMKMMIDNIKYPIVNCNYDFSNTPMRNTVTPYVILNKKGIKIGIVGVGIDPEGLIQRDKYTGMKFKPIIETVNYYANELRNQEKCDLVICLSHIGIEADKELAEKSKDIDLIVGGHSHTYLDAPVAKRNTNQKEVMIHQVGSTGAFIGKIELDITK